MSKRELGPAQVAGHLCANYPLIAALLGPVILFGPMLIQGEALFWGTPLLQFVPWRMYAFEMIAAGYVPLWNPLLGMGAPLLANYQSALIYPPNLLLAFFGPAWGQGLLVMLLTKVQVYQCGGNYQRVRLLSLEFGQ